MPVQTGAGKTFTMSGDLRHFQHRGLIPQAIHQIFREIDMRTDKLYQVHVSGWCPDFAFPSLALISAAAASRSHPWGEETLRGLPVRRPNEFCRCCPQVSYLELYNDQMYDLLSERPGSSDALAILEDPSGGTYIRGLTKVKVGSEEEALMQYFAGDQGRSTAGHVLNATSSRSHTVFTVHLEMRTSEAASERAVLSKLNLVDLAGSGEMLRASHHRRCWGCSLQR